MDAIYKYVSQLANSQRRMIDRLAKGKEYSGGQGKILHFLLGNRDTVVYQKDVEQVFGMRAATATRLIRSLEEMGVIRRQPGKTDGRYKQILLTEQADAYELELVRSMQRLEERLTHGIEPEKLETWVDVTRTMLKNLEVEENEE